LPIFLAKILSKNPNIEIDRKKLFFHFLDVAAEQNPNTIVEK
jgi:hypothetical protein